MNIKLLPMGWLLLAAVSGPTQSASAECAILHDSLNDASGIASNSGSIAGTLTFPIGVNLAAAAFNGSTTVTYAGDRFSAPAGSLSFWVRGNGASAQGGIIEIGVIGQPTSLGVFYVNGGDLVIEMRSDASELGAAWAPGALSTASWTHVAACWSDRSEGTDLWLFTNGRFRGYGFVPGPSTRSATNLRIGATGYYGGGQVILDELRFFDWNLHDSEVYAEFVVSANRHNPQPASKPVSTGPVRVVDGRLEVAGEPFSVRGVGYQPTPIGMPIGLGALAYMYTDPAILARDLPLLRAMRANTIRTWSPPPDETLLDALHNGGADPIYAIIGFWIPASGLDYSNPVATAPVEADFAALVNQFKDHPALLAWGLGNEVNLSLTDAELPDFFAFADKLAQIAYNIEGDGYHPTILINGYMLHLGDSAVGADDAALPNVDLWGQNLYFGHDPHCTFDYYRTLTTKPLILTEFGIDARDHRIGAEYASVQADYDVRQWRYLEPNSLGGVVFEYCDEWWKAGDPSTQGDGGYGTHWHPDGFSDEEWYGIVAMSDAGAASDIAAPRAAYHRLAVEFAHDPGDHDADGDVDLRDYAAFQRCMSLPAEGACGSAFETQVDDVITPADAPAFVARLSGPQQQ